MILTNKEVACVCLVCIAIAFLLGWLFPVEGPLDYIYDNAVKKKSAKVVAPQQKPGIATDIAPDYDIYDSLLDLMTRSDEDE